MAEQSGFFDAHLVDNEYDRVYLAEHFANYFANFIGNGIFAGKSNELMVLQNETPNMSVKVLSGKAWIDGYWYDNTDELSLAIDIADGVLNRIDIIVVRWNNIDRVMRTYVKKGIPTSNPIAPALQRDNDVYELKLAEIYIKSGATNITQANITDTRLDSSVCGYVHALVEQLDASEFGIQLNSFIDQFMENSENWMSQFKADSNSQINSLITTNQAKIDKLLSDGQSNIDEVVETGEANLSKVASDGQTNINNVATTGQQNIAKVVSDGQANINNVVTTGTTNINKVVTDGQKDINNVVNTGTTNINNLITTKTAEVDQVISNSQERFDTTIGELEKIAADNEMVVIKQDINTLKQDVNGAKTNIVNINGRVNALEKLVLESSQYPGCFYRIINGNTEWINPPNMPGFEYMLTERWNGDAVYQRVIYAAALPNKTVMSIHVNAYFDEIVSITGFAIDSDNNMHYQFPIILNGLTPAAVISFAEGDGGAGSDITINTNDDLTSFKAYITVKYTKKARG